MVLSYRGNGFSGTCALQVFVDGMEIGASDVNTVPPSSIHAIEVYGVSTAPAKYHVKNCGALFIWTK
jgi:hypothetical protein